MDRQTLRDWVQSYNDEGIDGLYDRKTPGRNPCLTPARNEELAALVREGPDPEVHGVVRWRSIRARLLFQGKMDSVLTMTGAALACPRS